MFQVRPADMVSSRCADSNLELCYRGDLGLGVRSLVGFSKGDVLDHFDGKIGPEITQHSLQVSPGRHISDTEFVGYLSHGCTPNCALDMHGQQLIALQNIEPDELLRIDYSATEDTLFAEFKCKCGASNCRGWITGRSGTVEP